jgi:hypothetical protein
MKDRTNELVKASLKDWKEGTLGPEACLLAIDSLVNPAKITGNDLRWAKGVLHRAGWGAG